MTDEEGPQDAGEEEAGEGQGAPERDDDASAVAVERAAHALDASEPAEDEPPAHGWVTRRVEGWSPPPADEPEPDTSRLVWDPALRRHVAPGLTPDTATAPSPGSTRREPEPAPFGRGLAAIVAGVAGAIVAIVAMLFVPGPVRRAPEPAAPSTPAPSAGGVQAPGDVRELARTGHAWVVNVSAAGTSPQAFTRFGSGVVIRPDGVIATTARLVDGASKLTVTLPHGRAVDADVVGSDALTDLAILRVKVTELPAAVLGTAEFLDLAEPVVMVASPAGAQPTVVTGSVAGFARTVDAGEGRLLFDMIQIEAPLGLGGGGAVVLGTGGSAVAITSSLVETAGTSGYAIPIDVVRSVANQILDGGKAAHPWVGLAAQPLDEESAARVGKKGLIVVRVFDGPASRKIEPGDVIVAVDGREVEGPLTLLKRVLEHKVAEEVTLRVIRGDRETDVRVPVAEQPAR